METDIDLVTVETVETVETEEAEETVETVDTVETVETVETVYTEDLKKYHSLTHLGKGSKKKIEKKLTNVSFMYVCVAGNGEMLVFFRFFPQQ